MDSLTNFTTFATVFGWVHTIFMLLPGAHAFLAAIVYFKEVRRYIRVIVTALSKSWLTEILICSRHKEHHSWYRSFFPPSTLPPADVSSLAIAEERIRNLCSIENSQSQKIESQAQKIESQAQKIESQAEQIGNLKGRVGELAPQVQQTIYLRERIISLAAEIGTQTDQIKSLQNDVLLLTEGLAAALDRVKRHEELLGVKNRRL